MFFRGLLAQAMEAIGPFPLVRVAFGAMAVECRCKLGGKGAPALGEARFNLRRHLGAEAVDRSGTACIEILKKLFGEAPEIAFPFRERAAAAGRELFDFLF